MSTGNNGDGEGGNDLLYWFIVFLIAFFLIGAFIMSVGGN